MGGGGEEGATYKRRAAEEWRRSGGGVAEESRKSRARDRRLRAGGVILFLSLLAGGSGRARVGAPAGGVRVLLPRAGTSGPNLSQACHLSLSSRKRKAKGGGGLTCNGWSCVGCPICPIIRIEFSYDSSSKRESCTSTHTHTITHTRFRTTTALRGLSCHMKGYRRLISLRPELHK